MTHATLPPSMHITVRTNDLDQHPFPGTPYHIQTSTRYGEDIPRHELVPVPSLDKLTQYLAAFSHIIIVPDYDSPTPQIRYVIIPAENINSIVVTDPNMRVFDAPIPPNPPEE